MEKWRPWERKARISGKVPSKCPLGIVRLVQFRCSSGDTSREPAPARAGPEGWEVLLSWGSLVQSWDQELVRFLVFLSQGESASEPGELFPSLFLYRQPSIPRDKLIFLPLLTYYQSVISNEGNLTRDSMELGHSHIGWLVIFWHAHHTYSSQSLSNIYPKMFAFLTIQFQHQSIPPHTPIPQ